MNDDMYVVVCHVNLDWESSKQTSLYVERVQLNSDSKTNKSPDRGYVPAKNIQLLSKHSSSSSSSSSLNEIKTPAHSGRSGRSDHRSNVTELDSVWQPPHSITSYPHFCNMPLTLEAGLDSFCWPLSTTQFLHEFYYKNALVVHSTGQRLQELKKDLCDLNLSELLQSSTRVNVWMKTTEGKMQYIDSNAEIAMNCYKAGHSLYFNPSMAIQTKYITALASDLKHDFGLEKDGGIGGDLEIFAVQGPHRTPWHFDAQENFTVQLRGSKTWTVAPSGVSDPVTNLHPLSSNREAVENDFKAHLAYTDGRFGARSKAGIETETQDVEHSEHSEQKQGQQTFTLRPGSVAYVPAGRPYIYIYILVFWMIE